MSHNQKLIRDKIPDLINSQQQKCQVEILSDLEYKKALKAKLIEESQEIFNSTPEDLLEEIADVYEVLDALIETYNLDKQDILNLQAKKAKLKGKFEQKIKLLAIHKNCIQEEEKKYNQEFFQQAEVFLQEQVLPQAEELDRNCELLKTTLHSMNAENPQFFRLKLDQQLGGKDLDQQSFFRWQMMIATYSGALAFLQTQHQSAVAMLNNSQNETVKTKYIPQIITENSFIGVGFSHLRKKSKPAVQAVATDNGYQISGQIPWITGYGIFRHFIVGATLPTGEELYGVLPFQSASSQLQFSAPLSLGAMNSTNTVCASLDNYLLASENVVMIRSAGKIHQQDQKNVLNHGFFPLGCSYAGLKILQENYQQLNLGEIESVYLGLKAQVENLSQEMLAMVNQPNRFEQKLALRIQAINLAYRCAIAAIISSRGKANYNLHPANRIYREALVYSVSGQTTSVLTGCLQDLV